MVGVATLESIAAGIDPSGIGPLDAQAASPHNIIIPIRANLLCFISFISHRTSRAIPRLLAKALPLL
jgi:hypothetical protein